MHTNKYPERKKIYVLAHTYRLHARRTVPVRVGAVTIKNIMMGKARLSIPLCVPGVG